MPTRIAIYAGTFNPVHAGHISFALQALAEANLDELYFLPERQPRGKKGVEHLGHRIAMLERALALHPKLGVLELPDINFSVQRTIPRLKKLFPDAQLVFLFGSDVLLSLPEWPYSAQLLKHSELVVGLRSDHALQDMDISHWKVQPQQLTIIKSYAPLVTSSRIREALAKRKTVKGLLDSVVAYSNRHWLYVSLKHSQRKSTD